MVVTDFNRNFYSNDQPRTEVNTIIGGIRIIAVDEIRSALKGIRRGKMPREDSI